MEIEWFEGNTSLFVSVGKQLPPIGSIVYVNDNKNLGRKLDQNKPPITHTKYVVKNSYFKVDLMSVHKMDLPSGELTDGFHHYDTVVVDSRFTYSLGSKQSAQVILEKVK